MGNSNGEHQPNSETSFHIPFDLFVSKKQKKGFGTGSFIRFTDSLGNLVFKVERPSNNKDKSSTAPHSVKLLCDGSGKTLISILKVKTGSWQGFRVHDNREELIFRAEERQNKLTKTEFDIFLIGENDQHSDFKMKGCPFKRSCTVYKDDSILAEVLLLIDIYAPPVIMAVNTDQSKVLLWTEQESNIKDQAFTDTKKVHLLPPQTIHSDDSLGAARSSPFPKILGSYNDIMINVSRISMNQEYNGCF